MPDGAVLEAANGASTADVAAMISPGLARAAIAGRVARDDHVEVFDLQADPREERNLYDPDDPACTGMTEELTSYKNRLVKGYLRLQGRDAETLLPEAVEVKKLRGLGYIN